MKDDIALKGLETHYYRKRIVRLCALASGVILAVLLSASSVTALDKITCMLAHGSIIGEASYYSALAIALLLSVLTFVLIPKEKQTGSVMPEENKYLYYYALDNACVKIVRYAVAFVTVLQGTVRTVLVISGAEKPAMPTVTVAIMLVSVIPFALFFLPEITEKFGKGEGRMHMMLGCFGLVYPLLNVLNSYFDKSYSYGSEYIILQQLCFVSVILAVVYDIRYRLDGTKIRARIAALSVAFALCFGNSFARTLMIVTVGAVSGTDICITFTLLAFSAYCGVRLFFYDED